MKLRIQGGDAPYQMVVCLETRDGEHVQNVEIPAFKMLPEVLIWGDRLFVQAFPSSPPVYREAFGYVVAALGATCNTAPARNCEACGGPLVAREGALCAYCVEAGVVPGAAGERSGGA